MTCILFQSFVKRRYFVDTGLNVFCLILTLNKTIVSRGSVTLGNKVERSYLPGNTYVIRHFLQEYLELTDPSTPPSKTSWVLWLFLQISIHRLVSGYLLHMTLKWLPFYYRRFSDHPSILSYLFKIPVFVWTFFIPCLCKRLSQLNIIKVLQIK